MLTRLGHPSWSRSAVIALGWLLIFGATAQAAAFSWPASLQAVPTLTVQNGANVADLLDAACWSASSCVSVGEDDVSGAEQAVVVPETAGVPGQAVAVQLPANAASGSGEVASLDGVSCSGSGACVAVGEYRDTSGVTDGLVVPISGGVAGTGVEVTAAGASGEFYLRSVSCPSDGACAAVGSFGVDANAYQEGVVVAISGGIPGTATQVTLPSNADTTGPLVQVNSVSCWSSGTCVAVGQYQTETSQGAVDPIVIPISNGVPTTALQVTLPGNAFSNTSGQQSVLSSVSCQTTGACVAAGSYVDTSGSSQPLLVNVSGGTPAPAGAVSLPGNSTGPAGNAGLRSVSCAASGPCSAVGYYVDTDDSQEPLIVPVSNGVVAGGLQANLPANALTSSTGNQDATLTAVTCPTSGSCLAVGDFYDSSDYEQGLIVPISGADPQTANESTPPGGTTADPYVTLARVACAGSGSCFAVGQSETPTAQTQAYLYSLQGPLAIAAVSLPAASVGSAYDQALSATGAWNTYSWSVLSGGLPPGLNLNAQTGVISGTATTTGSYTLTVKATGTGDPVQTATQPLSIVVGPTTTPTLALNPSLTTGGLKLSGRIVSLNLKCASAAACHGTVKLVYVHEVTLKNHRRSRVSTVVGSAGYSLAAGRSLTLKLKLSTAGVRFVKAAKKHRLSITVQATVVGGKSRSVHTTVRIPAPKPTTKKEKSGER